MTQESSGDPNAIRYESCPDRARPNQSDTPGRDDGVTEDDKSYGLLQVMGWNLREIVGVAPNTLAACSRSFPPMGPVEHPGTHAIIAPTRGFA